MKTQILSASPTIKSIALAASLTALASPAHASPTPPPPILTFSNFSFTSVDTGLTGSSTLSSGNYNTNSWLLAPSVTTGVRSETTPAAPGLAGSINVYKDVTTTTTTEVYSYFSDNGKYSVQGNANNYAAGQWISITGTVNASQDTTFSLSLNALGNYQTLSNSGIPGNLTPALPSLFWVNGTIANPVYSSVPTTTYTNPGINQYSIYANNNYNTLLAAGNSVITALVYTQGNVSLANFALGISGSAYGITDTLTPQSNTVSTILTSVAIPALAIPAVPLPASAWFFMAGLIGLIYNGKKKAHIAAW
jgi:hypothetical protein